MFDPMMRDIKIAVIMTVHNRAALTMRCLQAVHDTVIDGISLTCFVVDDGSSDATSELVNNAFPDVQLIRGSGSLFWSGGMRLAEQHALLTEPDLILWLNDDIDLDQDYLERLLKAWVESADRNKTIVVGALADPKTGELTYSGYTTQKSKFLFRLETVVNHSSRPTQIDTFNGNLVLIPRAVAEKVEGTSNRLTHHYADFDYGLRAKKEGATILLAPGIYGRTARNGIEGTFRDPLSTRYLRIRTLTSPKGFPLAEKAFYLHSHGPWLWPIQWAGFYIYWIFRILRRR